MKKQLFALILAFMPAFYAITSYAQTSSGTTTTTGAAAAKTLKLGYTNVQYVLSVGPRTKEIESELKTRGAQLQKEIENRMRDLETKFETYEKGKATMLESIRKDKENEIRNLQTALTTLQQNAQSELKAKEEELLKPELDKVYKAINDVAKENGYTHIFNSDQVLLYAEEQFDVTDLVIKKLGYGTAAAPVRPVAKPAPAQQPAPKKKK